LSQASGYQISADAAKAREQCSVRYMMTPWAPGLVATAALQPGERVLDLACGSGLIARLAAQQVGPSGRVTGVDINASMLDVARSLPPPAGASITWVQSSAEAMDLPDAEFDAVLCQQGFQFFPDKPGALSEMRRVLVPGGRLAFSVWTGPGPFQIAIGEGLERQVDPDLARRFRLHRVVPDADTLHRMLVAAGFRDVEIRQRAMSVRLPPMDSFLLSNLSGTPLAEALARVSEERRAALVAHVEAALQPYADRDGVSVPDEINIATARK
jgi:SAM-dependent methyltransferase